MSDYEAIVGRLRTSFMSGKTKPLEYRQTQLKNLAKLVEENKPAINEALWKDLRKSSFEAVLSETSMIATEVDYALINLKTWMKDEHVDRNLATTLDSAFIRKDPFGVVLIIGPWNYPLHLMLIPLVGAISAGNCAVLKPSEVATATEKIVSDLLPRYLDQECFAVVCGGPQETTQLLENKFDYIFFTGSPNVGKIIMTAAAKKLTPITLELGGKNPCYIDDRCDIKTTANRVVWSRFFNAGQTCIAVDYILCTKEMRDKLVPVMKETLEEFYGKDPQKSPDFGRIINDRHFQRVKGLMASGTIVIGGETDENEKYIAPTVLVDVKDSDPVMKDEIFGPVLPFRTVENIDEAIAFINKQERPLATYAFSPNTEVVERVLNETSSGGFCGNDGIMHLTLITLPFGGIGNSGMGMYHGKFGFDCFTHRRAVLHRSFKLENVNSMRYPPYKESNLNMLLPALHFKRGLCTIL